MASEPSILSKALSKWLSGENRTQKAFLNAVAAAIDYGARIVVGFVINPLLVAGLGTHAFGLWQVLRQLVGYASPASGRPTQALKWTIAKEQASTDYEAKRRYVGSTLRQTHHVDRNRTWGTCRVVFAGPSSPAH